MPFDMRLTYTNIMHTHTLCNANKQQCVVFAQRSQLGWMLSMTMGGNARSRNPKWRSSCESLMNLSKSWLSRRAHPQQLHSCHLLLLPHQLLLPHLLLDPQLRQPVRTHCMLPRVRQRAIHRATQKEHVRASTGVIYELTEYRLEIGHLAVNLKPSPELH